MSLDAPALKNLHLCCEFQSHLLFIISLLLLTFWQPCTRIGGKQYYFWDNCCVTLYLGSSQLFPPLPVQNYHKLVTEVTQCKCNIHCWWLLWEVPNLPTNTNSQDRELYHTWKSAKCHFSLGNFTVITRVTILLFTMQDKGITQIIKKIKKYCTIKFQD